MLSRLAPLALALLTATPAAAKPWFCEFMHQPPGGSWSNLAVGTVDPADIDLGRYEREPPSEVQLVFSVRGFVEAGCRGYLASTKGDRLDKLMACSVKDVSVSDGEHRTGIVSLLDDSEIDVDIATAQGKYGLLCRKQSGSSQEGGRTHLD